eukprot:COSAG04_NODE_26837_length_290_cov_0.806283_1_plen_20_part_10
MLGKKIGGRIQTYIKARARR